MSPFHCERSERASAGKRSPFHCERRPWLLFTAGLLLTACPKSSSIIKPASTPGPPPAFAGIDAFDSRPVLESESAQVRFDPAAKSVQGEAQLVIRDEGIAEFPIVFDAHLPGSGGFNLLELSQDGTPCRWEAYGEEVKVVVVRLPRPAKTVKLKMRWKGSPTPGIGRGFVLPDEVLLLDVEGWLPYLPAGEAAFDLDVTWPASFEMLLETATPPKEAGKGWLTSHTRFRSNCGTSVFARPHYAIRRFELGETHALVAVPAGGESALPGLEERVTAAWKALTPLGPLPEADLRVVQATMTEKQVEAFGGRGFIAVRARDPDIPVLTHELGHSWFGGTIFAATVPDDVLGRKAARTELWPESLAEYASTWSMDPTDFRFRRAEWLQSYAGMFGEAIVLGRSVASYTRAPLLLAGIEHRVGRPKMEEALAGFVRANKGKKVEWKDITEAIGAAAGPEEAADLLAWVSHPGAPDLHLTDIEVDKGVLTANLVQHSTPPYPGTLELAFVAQAFDEPPRKPLSVKSIVFRGASTPVRLEIPAGAKTLYLDPDVWIPRSLGDPTQPGILSVPLDRKIQPASSWFLKPP